MREIKESLSESRIKNIQLEMHADWERWEAIYDKIWKRNGSSHLGKNKIDYSKASWESFATTNPSGNRMGVRGCIAFHKSPCAWKKQTNGKGCTHCALSLNDKDLSCVPPKDQIAAVATAMTNIAKKLGEMPAVLEILPDGSFLNPDEVSGETQDGIFDLVAKNNKVKRIAIESRSGYISANKIRHILSLLRDDQILEIYVGLESIDDFVLNQIIKKGFTVKEYEKMIEEVTDGLSDKEKKSLHFSVYHFFKPPYLTEKESIDSAIAMIEKVKKFEEQTGIKFSVKYEPAVISNGTFQKYLFDQEKYSPPNYFSVAEIVASAYFYNFLTKIKFGQRDDIDNFQTVAAIPSPEKKSEHMFSSFDFMVYNAVQRFNVDQDIWGFCADMSITLRNAPEFGKWEEETYGAEGRSFLSKIFTKYEEQDLGEKYEERIEFQKKVWKCLDIISYNSNSLSSEIRKKGKSGASDVSEKIISIFLKNNIKVLEIKNINFFDVGKIHNAPKLKDTHPEFANATEESAYQYEIVISNEMGLPQSVWEKVPLCPVNVYLEKFNFIYGDKE
ncbi:hypothetical protein CMI41_03850 [Candidatus Pacearchaeota archaeon]|nr:hypothetical protein [Candidatus Pacearchaeota archaeon]|tara:strand:- start:1207 stop:2880 length:1674 start_codon:yes stop_codon:yes gene_type:complete